MKLRLNYETNNFRFFNRYSKIIFLIKIKYRIQFLFNKYIKSLYNFFKYKFNVNRIFSIHPKILNFSHIWFFYFIQKSFFIL